MRVTTPSALSGRRVLELAGESGAYCGKLLAEMGADVIKIEPPGGDAARNLPPFWHDQPDPNRGLSFLYLNSSKRSITLDLDHPEGQALFKQLARTGDIVIETFPPGYLDGLGLGYGKLKVLNPRLVLTSITGFGQTGPYKDFHSADLVAAALGGALHVTGEADDPPVTLAGSQADMMASTYAAVSSLIALHHSTRTGIGQHVDISAEEVTASVTHVCGAGKWLDDQIIARRRGPGLFAAVPSGAYSCRDGAVYLIVNRPAHWRALAQWIFEVTGNRAVLDPIFDGQAFHRYDSRDLLDHYIAELTAHFTVAEFYHQGQRRHLAVTPVNRAAAVVHDAQLAAREYFVSVDHGGGRMLRYPGAPYRHAETPWRITRPAPRLGEHNEEIYCGELGLSEETLRTLVNAGVVPKGVAPVTQRRSLPSKEGGQGGFALVEEISGDPPFREGEAVASAVAALAGLRVVEFTAGMAGPWIGRHLAYCGAEVIKVESQKRPDVTRAYIPPWAPEMGIQTQLSPWFTDWNAGKRFVTLDLTQPQAVDLAKRLVASCDVVVENYSTGVMDKLGLGYQELRRVKPDLIMLSSSGFGDSGPCRSYITWGPNIEAVSGLGLVSGLPERPCTITQYAYPDTVSALHGLFAVLCALEYRRRSARGQNINLSQFEATVSVAGHVLMEYLANGREPERLGNRSRHAAPHGCYRCRGDDRWCAIAVSSQAQWQRFARAMGDPAWAADARFATFAARLEHAAELDRLIEEWTAGRDAYDVMSRLQAAGVAAGVVQNIEDQFRRDRQLAARGFFEEIAHAKKGTVVANGIPLGLTGTPGRSGQTGAALGQDNDYVFGELLGLTPDEIQAYVEAGAIERE
ncbi:MAG: CoA transferase [Deltaproteobacteria bacterium]|nr:CoA transferase [Deltaproteobacteria bacterium]